MGVFFSCSPQARQLILQYGLTLSDLDRHPEVRERGTAVFYVSFFMAVTCVWALGYLVESRRKVSESYIPFLLGF